MTSDAGSGFMYVVATTHLQLIEDEEAQRTLRK